MNKVSLNRNQLKFIAVFAMLLDHIAMMFVPISGVPGVIMRTIGRLTAPIMCMFVAQGYYYTSSKRNYGLRLLIFALVSQPFYAIVHGNKLWYPDFNMIFTLLLCFLVLLSYEKIKDLRLKTISIVILILVSAFCDWAFIAPMWTLTFYVFRSDKSKTTLSYCLVSAIHVISCICFEVIDNGNPLGQLWQLGVYLFVPLIFLYNGKSGKKNAFTKYFFYVFYPFHLFVLWLIQYFLV